MRAQDTLRIVREYYVLDNPTEELCEKAELNGKKLTSIYDDLYDWEAVR